MKTEATPMPEPDADERRASPRFAAATPWARLAWGVGRPPYPSSPARLIDVSEGGMQLLSGWLPEGVTPGHVWVRIDELPWEWVRASVRAVRYRRGRRALWTVHLAFSEPCPRGLLDHALAREPDQAPDEGVPMTFWYEREW